MVPAATAALQTEPTLPKHTAGLCSSRNSPGTAIHSMPKVPVFANVNERFKRYCARPPLDVIFSVNGAAVEDHCHPRCDRRNQDHARLPVSVPSRRSSTCQIPYQFPPPPIPHPHHSSTDPCARGPNLRYLQTITLQCLPATPDFRPHSCSPRP